MRSDTRQSSCGCLAATFGASSFRRGALIRSVSFSYLSSEMSIEVQHWSGAGNRFAIVDARETSHVDRWDTLIPRLCQRKTLPDAEGVLVLLELDSKKAKCNYDFYNPDGSTGVMCGNGARCAVQHALRTEPTGCETIELVLNGRTYAARVFGDDRVALVLPLYKELRLIDAWTYVNVGSHHVIIDARDLVQSIEDFHRFDLVRFANENLGTYRDRVGITSLNLNIAYRSDDGSAIQLRTYENGVFDETQACGTGAVSTAIALYTRRLVSGRKVACMPKSGRLLTVHLNVDDKNGDIVGMVLEGDARQDAPASQFTIASMQYD